MLQHDINQVYLLRKIFCYHRCSRYCCCCAFFVLLLLLLFGLSARLPFVLTSSRLASTPLRCAVIVRHRSSCYGAQKQTLKCILGSLELSMVLLHAHSFGSLLTSHACILLSFVLLPDCLNSFFYFFLMYACSCSLPFEALCRIVIIHF